MKILEFLRACLSQNSRGRNRGVTSIEYALLGSLVAIAIVTAVGLTGTNLGALYEQVMNRIASALG